MGDGAGGGGHGVHREGVAGGFVGVGVVAEELGVGQGQRAAFGDGERSVVDRGRGGVGGGDGDSAGGGCNNLTRTHDSRCGRGCPGPAEFASGGGQHRPRHGRLHRSTRIRSQQRRPHRVQGTRCCGPGRGNNHLRYIRVHGNGLGHRRRICRRRPCNRIQDSRAGRGGIGVHRRQRDTLSCTGVG